MYEYQAYLLRVIDGDTIDVDIDLGFNIKVKKRIRLYHIDTWELRTRDLEEKKRGFAAKARLEDILKQNNNTFVLISHGVGKFGRVLGTIKVGSIDGDSRLTDVVKQLISEGYAKNVKSGQNL